MPSNSAATLEAWHRRVQWSTLLVPKPGADQLLEEVRLLVGALGRAEAGERPRAVLGVDRLQPRRRRGRAPRPTSPRGSAASPRRSRRARRACGARAPRRARRPTAGPWGRYSSRRMSGIVSRCVRGRRSPSRSGPSRTAGACEPGCSRPSAQAIAFALVVDVDTSARSRRRSTGTPCRPGAAPCAAGSARVDRLVGEGPGRAGGHALAARHARGLAHRVVEVERDPRRVALAGAADDVVALDVVARPHAAVAQDARVVVDGDDRVREVVAAAVAAGSARPFCSTP